MLEVPVVVVVLVVLVVGAVGHMSTVHIPPLVDVVETRGNRHTEVADVAGVHEVDDCKQIHRFQLLVIAALEVKWHCTSACLNQLAVNKNRELPRGVARRLSSQMVYVGIHVVGEVRRSSVLELEVDPMLLLLLCMEELVQTWHGDQLRLLLRDLSHQRRRGEVVSFLDEQSVLELEVQPGCMP